MSLAGLAPPNPARHRAGAAGSGRRWFRLTLTAAVLAGIAAASALPWLSRPGHHHMTMSEAQPQGTSGARAGTAVHPLSCERLAEIPGKTVRTLLVDFPPGAHTPRHRHPGSVTAFVVRGSIRSQLNGGPIETFTAGQTWFEPFGTVHDFAENASGSDSAQLLAVFVTDEDCGPLTVFED